MVWTHPPAGEAGGHCFLAGCAMLGDQESTGFGEAGAVTILCRVHRRVGCRIAASISVCLTSAITQMAIWFQPLCISVPVGWKVGIVLCYGVLHCAIGSWLKVVTWCFVVLYWGDCTLCNTELEEFKYCLVAMSMFLLWIIVFVDHISILFFFSSIMYVSEIRLMGVSLVMWVE